MNWIRVNANGSLIIGSVDCPITTKVTITFFGNRTTNSDMGSDPYDRGIEIFNIDSWLTAHHLIAPLGSKGLAVATYGYPFYISVFFLVFDWANKYSNARIVSGTRMDSIGPNSVQGILYSFAGASSELESRWYLSFSLVKTFVTLVKLYCRGLNRFRSYLQQH